MKESYQLFIKLPPYLSFYFSFLSRFFKEWPLHFIIFLLVLLSSLLTPTSLGTSSRLKSTSLKFIPQPIYFSQNSDSAVYLDVLKTTWVQLNSLSFPKSYYIYSHPISVDTKFIPQAAQGRNFRVIIVSYLSLTFNIYPSENSFGSTFKIYPESDVSHCLRCHHPHLNKYHLSHGLLQ